MDKTKQVSDKSAAIWRESEFVEMGPGVKTDSIGEAAGDEMGDSQRIKGPRFQTED